MKYLDLNWIWKSFFGTFSGERAGELESQAMAESGGRKGERDQLAVPATPVLFALSRPSLRSWQDPPDPQDRQATGGRWAPLVKRGVQVLGEQNLDIELVGVGVPGGRGASGHRGRGGRMGKPGPPGLQGTQGCQYCGSW